MTHPTQVRSTPRRLLAFVNTPFQLMCVAELIAWLREERVDPPAGAMTYLVANARADLSSTMVAVAREYDMNFRLLAVPRWIPRPFRTLWYLWRCRALSSELTENDILAAGNPVHDLFGDLLARARDAETWVVDDGNASVSLLQSLMQTGDPLRRMNFKGRLYYRVGRPMLGVRRPDWHRLSWFTIFFREFAEVPTVFPNRFRLTRSKGQLGKTRREIWFMGSPLVSSGIVSLSAFISWMKTATEALRSEFRAHHLVYMKHPGEDGSPAMEGAVYSQFDDVRESRGPVESLVMSGESVPEVVSSILSTSIITLRELLPSATAFIVWTPDLSEVAAGKVEHIKSVMEFIELVSRGRNIRVRTLT